MSRLARFSALFRKSALLAAGFAAILFFAGFDMDGPMSTIEVEGPVAQIGGGGRVQDAANRADP